MEISKSSRHQKIIGNFGESLICNWLSRSGFEVIVVDHTGIDIIAYNPSTRQRLGITVKSRTRNVGKERTSVNVFRSIKEDRDKLLEACKAFACEPWIGVYVETADFADIYLTSLENYATKYRGQQGRAVENWKMREKDKLRYAEDPKVKHIRIEFLAENWSWQQ
jgi:Holliday junction resolvase-like predicted endonuclease